MAMVVNKAMTVTMAMLRRLDRTVNQFGALILDRQAADEPQHLGFIALNIAADLWT